MDIINYLPLGALRNRQAERYQQALRQVMEKGQFVLGSAVTAFEQEFSQFINAKHTVGVGNGLDALRLVLEAWKWEGFLQPGDAVIVPANTYIATWLAVEQAGLKIIPVEPELDTFNISISTLTSLDLTKVKVVLPVHLYGRMAPMKSIQEWAIQNGIRILEDAAQAHGASVDGIKAGAWGDAAAFSFYPGKNLGAIGDAGAVTTAHADTAKRVRILGNYGSEKKYHNKYPGFNSRLDELQAAFLSIELSQLEEDNHLREKIAELYLTQINHPEIKLPASSKTGENVWHIFPVLCKRRSQFQEWLTQGGIQTLIHYPIPPYQQLAFRPAFSGKDWPLTTRIHSEILSLPIHPLLTPEEIEIVISRINAFPC